MKIPDVNILLYAVDTNSPQHARIRPWWESLLSSDEPIGFAWVALLGFLRISTRNVFPSPLDVGVACQIIEQWLAQANSIVIHPTEQHFAVLRRLIEATGTAGNLTTDAHVAALAIEYDGEVCSADSDFRRFSGVRWINPLD